MHFFLLTAALAAALMPFTLASPRAAAVSTSLAPDASTAVTPSSIITATPSPIMTATPNDTLTQPEDPTEPYFYVRNFRAFVPDASEPKLNAWIMFNIADGAGGPTVNFATTCSALYNGTMYTDGGYQYHACERHADHPNDRVGFRISEGFNEVVLKRQWRHGRQVPAIFSRERSGTD
jgi:hypothetical protein